MKMPKAALLPCLIIAAGPGIAHADDSAPPDNKTAQATDIAFFQNGDTLRGAMAGCDKEGLHWQTVYDKRPVVVTTKYLTEIRLHAGKIPDGAQLPENEVLFANGDVLQGKIVSFDGKSFLLDTWYAGRLTIPRDAVAGVTASAVIYQGPANMDGWVVEATAVHDNTWTCAGGVLANTGFGALGRDMKLPALARIQFELTLPSESTSLASVYFCADRASNPGSYYAFQFNSRAATAALVHYSRDTTLSNIGEPFAYDARRPRDPNGWVAGQDDWQLSSPADAGRKASTDPIHFDIRINREAGTIRVYVDGALAKEYSHLDDLKKTTGGALIFSSSNQAPMRIAKIQVGAWSGEPGDAAGSRAASGDDDIEASSRDAIHGKLKQIAGGKALVTTAQGDVEIPFAEIESIRLSSGAAAPDRRPGDVLAYLPGRAKVTLQIESWDSKQAVVTSPDFGKASFSSGAFEKLDFNLDKPHPLPVAPAQPPPTPAPPPSGLLIPGR